MAETIEVFRLETDKLLADLEKVRASAKATEEQAEKTSKKIESTYKGVADELKEVKVGDKQTAESVTNLKKVEKGIKDTTKEADMFTKSVKGFGASLLAALAFDRIIAFGTEVNKLAREMQQAERKAAIVFGDSLDKVTQSAKENALQIGLTTKEYIGAAAGIQDILVPLGFTREAAADLSIETTKLAGAISVWSGGTYDATEASQILTKALTGEVEQLKTVGIVIDQSSKRFNERIALLMETEGLTLQQAKALDILNQITEKSVDAQTNLAESQDDLATKQARVGATLREYRDVLISAAIPAIEELTTVTGDAIEEVESFGQSLVGVIQTLYEESAIIRGVYEGLISTITLNFQIMFKVLELIIAEPIRLAAAGFRAAKLLLKGETEGALAEVRAFGDRFLTDQKDFAKNVADNFKDAYDAVTGTTKEAVEENAKTLEQQVSQTKAAQNTIIDLTKLSNAQLLALGEQGNKDAKKLLQERFAIWEAEAEAARRQVELLESIISDATSGQFIEQPDLNIIPIDLPTEEIEEQVIGMNERLGVSYEDLAKRAAEIYAEQAKNGITQQQAYEMAVTESERRIAAERAASAASAIMAYGEVFTALIGLTNAGAKNSRELAVFQIAINSAAALASAIAGATSAAASTGPAAPVTLPLYVAEMVAIVLSGIAQAKAALEPAPTFSGYYEGTAYLQRGNNPKGIDTIPILANEGEAIIPTDKNAKYNGLAQAMINGRVEDWFSRYNWNTRYQVDDAPMINHNYNSKFSDVNIVHELRKTRQEQQDTNYLLSQLASNRKFKRAG